MRVHRKIQLALVSGLTAAALIAPPPAAADNEPVIVVPGRPGVPVMINGVDVSGAVLEGEWGLNRPGVVVPTVIMPYWPPNYFGSAGHYFPATGHRPPYGRLEVNPPPNRRLPPPAQPFFRAWGIESAPSPATEPVPVNPPLIVVAPRMARPHAPPAPPLPPPRPVPPRTP